MPQNGGMNIRTGRSFYLTVRVRHFIPAKVYMSCLPVFQLLVRVASVFIVGDCCFG
jgi:hypothetical protein